MTLSEELSQFHSIFIDTAPIIYYIEAHPQYGPLVKDVVAAFQSGILNAFSSVITIVEVLPKPIEAGNEILAKKFTEFLIAGKNISLMEITLRIAESAGTLRGRYPFLRAMDAIQIAASLEAQADAFITNDAKLKRLSEIKVIVLKEYLSISS
jgi:predicted nucleic acid-binding protein